VTFPLVRFLFVSVDRNLADDALSLATTAAPGEPASSTRASETPRPESRRRVPAGSKDQAQSFMPTRRETTHTLPSERNRDRVE